MDEYLLVDGYNIIFAWENLKKISENSLEDARDTLIHTLSDYQGYKKMNLIIVFDAHHVKGNTGSVIDYGNLFVVYTKEAETADSYIERTSSELGKRKYSVKVATSDGMEQIIIMGNGAVRVSARELELDVKAAKKSVRRKIEEIRPVKNNTLMSNVDEETAKWLEKMRRSK
ncbi:MAG: NYN domain-containing protein [Firmicutes bacterium]|nr:NYN domain-containing protein [Bacillota bacterium]